MGNIKNTALIGYTGFVGSNIARQHKFTYLYNSKNISDSKNMSFDLVVCAGARAEKWKINQKPQNDWEEITDLMDSLNVMSIKKLVLISTVDVYPNPYKVNESTEINPYSNHPYGKHRRLLELFCLEKFDTLVVRLPGLFGQGLKKNIIFDLLNAKNIDSINPASFFQYYNINHAWRDITRLLEFRNTQLVNISTEPISVREIAQACFHQKLLDLSENSSPVHYDMRSNYSDLLGGKNGYIYLKKRILSELKEFIANEA